MDKRILTVMLVVVLLVGVGIGYVIKPSPPRAIPISWRSTWIMQAVDAAMFTALDKGWYADEGMSLSIYRGFGSTATVTSVAEGRDAFGIGGWGALQSALIGGADIMGIGDWYGTSLNGLAFFEESNIRTPKDLEGKRIGLSPFDITFVEWPAFAEANNIDTTKVEIVNISTDLYLTSLFEGRVDAIGAFEDSARKFDHIASQQGQPRISWMGYRDWGLGDIVPYLRIVNKTFMNEHPDIVRKFNLVTNRGVVYAQEHTEEALQILKKYNPELDLDAERVGGQVSIPNLNPTGQVLRERIQYTLDLYRELLNFERTVTVEEIYTDEFLGP